LKIYFQSVRVNSVVSTTLVHLSADWIHSVV